MDSPSIEDLRKLVALKLQFLADIDSSAEIPSAQGKNLLRYFDDTCKTLRDLEHSMNMNKANMEADILKQYANLQEAQDLFKEKQNRDEENLEMRTHRLRDAEIQLEKRLKLLQEDKSKFDNEQDFREADLQIRSDTFKRQEQLLEECIQKKSDTLREAERLFEAEKKSWDAEKYTALAEKGSMRQQTGDHQLEKVFEQMQQMQTTLAEHGVKIDRRERQDSESLAGLHDRLENQAAQLQEKTLHLQEKTLQLDLAVEENTRLTGQLKNLERKNKRLQVMVSNMDDTVAELHAAKAEADNMAAGVLGELAGAREAVARSKKKLKEKDSEFSKMRNDLGESRKLADSLVQRAWFDSYDQGESPFVQQKWTEPRPRFPTEPATPQNIFGEPIRRKDPEPES